MSFEEKYKKLNSKQKEAVDSIEGPVMVIAGPGTGKTTILTLRIANILKKTDTPPSGILCLTFTDAGVKSMKSKLREIIGGRADEVKIHTFHSFASSVIGEFPEHFIHLHKMEQMTDVEKESILRNIISSKKYFKLRPLGDTDFYLSKIINAISDAKKEAWTPQTVKGFAEEEIERIKNDEESISTRGKSKGELKAEALKKIEKCERTILFTDIWSEYEKIKKEERKIDFDDLLFELVFALQKDELLLRLLQEKFLYILVDEHQDSNDSQNIIISLLANFFDSPNIFVVGDEKQAIYRFQGASVENFLKFQNIWKDMKIISLEDNYRSHQGILDAVFSMIEQNYGEGQYKDLRIPLKGFQSKKPIDVILSTDSDSADFYLLNELKRIQDNEPEKSVAVILRWNRDVDHILSICEENGIKVSAERGADIFSHPIGRIYFKILEYLDDPTKTESISETIVSGLWGVSFEESINLIKGLRSGNIKNIESEIPKLGEIKEQIYNLNPISFLIYVGDNSGLTDIALKDPLSMEVWRGVLALAKDLYSNKNTNSHDLIKTLLDYKKTSENKIIKIKGGVSDSKIEIMTAHSSKGLEYDYVFVPYALEEYWTRRKESTFFVFPKEKDNSDDIKDSRRLFYVALTRAKEHVVILIPSSDSLGKPLTPIRFVEELSLDSINKKDFSQKQENKIRSLNRVNIKKEKIIEYTKNVLKDNGLSVTALNHYINCPSQFLYKSILKVPEAVSPSSEKGIAMHKAISEVWQSDDKSSKNIENTIKNSIKRYFQKSFLSLNEKEIILDELLESAPLIAKSLESHFSLSGKVYTDKWVEKHISIPVLKDKIEVKIHGQLDALVDQEKELLVFDYKTKKSMTENAIKGLTANEDGGYFRQLVFYKLLLKDNSIYSGKKIVPSLVFIKPDEKGRCPIVSLSIAKEDEDNVLQQINSLLEGVYSGNFLESKCDDKTCSYCKLKEYYLK